jgi:hypothetical protein
VRFARPPCEGIEETYVGGRSPSNRVHVIININTPVLIYKYNPRSLPLTSVSVTEQSEKRLLQWRFTWLARSRKISTLRFQFSFSREFVYAPGNIHFVS